MLGSRTFQVQKTPRGGFDNDRNLDFREIARWPPLTLDDVRAIRKHVKSVDLVGAELWHYNTRVGYRGTTTEPISLVCGGTPEYPENNTHYVELGRNLTREDVMVGRNVVVLGFALANELFPFTDPIGKTVKVDGRKFTVQGVFAEKKSAMGGQYDNYVLMPITAWLPTERATTAAGLVRSTSRCGRFRARSCRMRSPRQRRCSARAAD